MFFTEREKMVYEAPGGWNYDPVVIDRRLVIATHNRLREYLELRNAVVEGRGDVSKEGVNSLVVDAAQAELALAQAARKAFELPDFPECTDGQALELLYHFLGWLEGKDEKAGMPPGSPETSPEPSSSEPTKTFSTFGSTVIGPR